MYIIIMKKYNCDYIYKSGSLIDKITSLYNNPHYKNEIIELNIKDSDIERINGMITSITDEYDSDNLGYHLDYTFEYKGIICLIAVYSHDNLRQVLEILYIEEEIDKSDIQFIKDLFSFVIK